MKTIIDVRGNRASLQELQAKIEHVKELLQKSGDVDQRDWLLNVAEILRRHTPMAYLIVPPAADLAEWIRQFAAFLEVREEETVKTALLPFGGQGHAFLLSNAPDAPFMFDSVQNLLRQRDLPYQVVAHPILRVTRQNGRLSSLHESEENQGIAESFIVIELEGFDPDQGQELETEVRAILREALAVAADRPRIDQTLADLAGRAEEYGCSDFWNWLQDGNFLPLSYVLLEKQADKLSVRSQLGMQPAPFQLSAAHPAELTELPVNYRRRLERSKPIIVEEVQWLSPLHRPEKLTYLGLRTTTPTGKLQEHIFFGLFTQQSIDELASKLSPLRTRIEAALATLGIPEGCYDYRKTLEIFNNFPKVQLFFMSDEELVDTVRSFTLLYRFGSIKVVAARHLAVHGLTLLVIMPRDYYQQENLARLETYISRFFKADDVSSRLIHVSGDYLSLHVSVQVEGGDLGTFELERLERGLTHIAQPWASKLQMLLEGHFGSAEGRLLWKKYRHAFNREYRTLVHPRFTLRDIRSVEQVLASGGECLDLWGPFGKEEPICRLQFYSLSKAYLNDIMPFLENLGLCIIDEIDFQLRVDEQDVYIKSFALRAHNEGQPAVCVLRHKLLDALQAMRRGECENDYLNRLLILTGLDWQEIDIFRGYRNYYFQLDQPFTKRRVAYALINNPQVSQLLYQYFEARFMPSEEWTDPLVREEEALMPIRLELAAALEQVSDVNEDQILRALFNLIDSTVRTNFFLRRDGADYFFSFKISAIGIMDMPAPRPLYEIYVHSASMEGIHLRGGTVARGGIRWSDRPDDFRTEILGLMKTQMTKNALIVPVGSKGGFIVKTPYTTREEGGELSKRAYQTLMRGLLDLTDNRIDDHIAHPKGVVAYDEEDPYLVVAADKGTAHLPDTANAVSAEYNFWLGDAFASGGSRGYDHKELGITARGAWECVKRHFREMGKDIQSQPFSVVGVGDMSGDVFGNGMLLSEQILLKAAFDHRHIFLDPNPDPATSFAERKRMFNLPRSSWDDYNKELISQGGGVFRRDAKDIPLSPEVRDWLGVRHDSIDPTGLIRLLLTAEVDLLWNGGIGTYVKASTEKHEDAGDRANDGLRIDGNQLRALVVGEGGNLGFTQKGRIEYALRGGRINTDAVDNSAGVDCSDHEVNLKIFMQFLQGRGVVSSLEERDSILAAVTDEVCDLVLANNYGQSLSLSLDQQRCQDNVEPFFELSNRLTQAGLLDRKGEFLPTEKEVLARSGKAYSRPELAILLAYSKMFLYQALLASDLPDQEGVRDELIGYFPSHLQERFGEQFPEHPLHREITATVITNVLINQAGSPFVHRVMRETGAQPVDVVRCYLLFDKVLFGGDLRQQIFVLDNRLSAERQHELLLTLENALSELVLWALKQNMDASLTSETIAAYREKEVQYVKNLGSILPAEQWDECKGVAEELEQAGFNHETSNKLAALVFLGDFLPLASLVGRTGQDLYSVARTYQDIRSFLDLPALQQLLDNVPVRDRWDHLTLQQLREGFEQLLFDLNLGVWQVSAGNPESYFSKRRRSLQAYRRLWSALMSGSSPVNFHPFGVLLECLQELVD